MAQDQNSYAKNVPLYYLSKLFRGLFLLVSINVMYYMTNGLSMTQVLLLASVMSIGIVVLEIPTGIFADKYGRKTSMLLSGLLLVVGYILLAFGSTFIAFMSAMLAMAASISFLSGAESAFIYDSLAAERNEHHYKKVESRAKTIGMIASALAALAGSYLYTIDIHLPYYLMVIFASLAFLCIVFMKEPPETSREKQGMVQYFKKSVRLILDDRMLVFLILFDALVFATVNVSYRFFQPMMKNANIPIASFGLVYMVLMVLGALVVYFQPLLEHNIEKKFGMNATLWIVPILMGVGFFSLSGSIAFLFIGIFLVQLLLAYLGPLMTIKVQDMIPSKERATTLSVMSFVGNLLLLIISPIFGFLYDKLGFFVCLLVLAVFGMVAAFAILIFYGTDTKKTIARKSAP